MVPMAFGRFRLSGRRQESLALWGRYRLFKGRYLLRVQPQNRIAKPEDDLEQIPPLLTLACLGARPFSNLLFRPDNVARATLILNGKGRYPSAQCLTCGAMFSTPDDVGW